MSDMSDGVGPGHLYTWVDIDNYFKAVAIRGDWPSWLLEVDAYWDSVEFSVRRDVDIEQFWNWIAENLGPLSVDRQRSAILLESDDEIGRTLPLRVALVDEVASFEPTSRWSERRVVRGLASELPVPTGREFPHGIQVCAFHSFKGGVGRTLHCVALAHEIAGRAYVNGNRIHKVLLVDADLEAPGVSWMIAAQGGRIDFAVEDFLALIHGAVESERQAVMKLARRFLVNQEYDGIVILPARRDLARIEPALIEPADLLSPNRSPYFLTEAFAELANTVGADAVLLDLRAGNSELSSPILLDPRVHRVLVTTVSDQSVRGTVALVKELGRRAPSRFESDPVCKVIVTQFQEKDHEGEVAVAAGVLTDAVAASVRIDGAEGRAVGEGLDTVVDRDAVSALLTSPFDPQLLALPGSWGAVRNVIDATQISRCVASLTDSMFPDRAEVVTAPAAGGGVGQARAGLRVTANALVFAENSTSDDELLPTDGLTSLVSTHRTESPIEIVVGAKGSGKTYTYLRMCLQGNWRNFASLTSVRGVELDAPIVPVLGSQNLSDDLQRRVEQVQDSSAKILSDGEPARFLAIRDLVTESLERDLNDIEWRRVWLACLCRAAGGGEAVVSDAEGWLTGLARRRRAIFVLDGLEDLFQQFSTDVRQQRALRVLLTSCPEWLRSLRGHPLGLVVFVRRDLVTNSIHQNTDQFLARYRSSELRWNRTEALRLAAWVCERANAIETSGVSARSATARELSSLLVQLWGQKLGSTRSREARSEEWFLAALSDFNQQIQARDIVSFLAEAARIAVEETRVAGRWDDRVLPPAAMRRALPVCSKEKIVALSLENKPVGGLLNRLSALNSEVRKVPFTLESVGLEASEARLLEVNGVLFREEDQYWIPEIYRHGLDFGVTGVGRPRVLAVANLVRRRNDA